jgi:YgiT-type zinc finger domain-containing protein
MNEEKSTDSQSEEHAQAYTVCTECQTGVLHLQYITYFTWLNEELVTVPNFPAWICDVCGRRDYDTRAITWLNTLLNPEAGRRPASRRRPGRRPHRTDRPQPKTP